MATESGFMFYASTWYSETIGMSMEEKGALMELLLLQFTKGPFNEASAKHMLSTCSANAWNRVKQNFKTDGLFFWNEKLKIEIDKRKRFCESRRENALKSLHLREPLTDAKLRQKQKQKKIRMQKTKQRIDEQEKEKKIQEFFQHLKDKIIKKKSFPVKITT